MSIFAQAVNDTFTIIGRTLPVIAVTLIGMELLSVLGLFRCIQRLMFPLVRLAYLPPTAGPALITAFGSSLSADTMIAADHRAGRINGRQTLLAAQANTLPAYVTETFTYMVPVMLPALGKTPGVFCLAAFLLTGLIKSIIIIIAGRCIASSTRLGHPITTHSASYEVTRKALHAALKRSIRMLVRIALLLTATALLTALALRYGWLSGAVHWLKPILDKVGIPYRLAAPILGYVASPMAGAAAIGTLFKSKVVDTYAATMAALLGSLLSMPVFALRYSLARNISIFGLVMGSLNTALSLCIGIIARLIILAILPLMLF
jgi:hypothetical protein